MVVVMTIMMYMSIPQLRIVDGRSQMANPANIIIITTMDVLRSRSPAGTFRFVSGNNE